MSPPPVRESPPPPALTSPPPPALRALDAWRGLAALWVVMLHACLPAIASRWPELQTQPLFALSLHGQLGVSIFFVISGYCITSTALGARRKSRPTAGFLRARMRRIYPPYLAASALVVLASTLLAVLVTRGVLQRSSLASLDFFHHGFLYYFSAATLTQLPLRQELLLPVFWSLSYEVAFYFIVAVALWATSRAASASGLLWTLHGITFGALLWLLLGGQSCPFPLNLWPQFGLGALVLHVALTPGRALPKVAAGLAMVLGLLHGWRAPWVPALGLASPLAQALGSAAFACALLALRPWDARLARWRLVRFCAWVGTFSYSLYLTHLLVLGAVSQLMLRLGVTPSTFWVAFLAQVALSVVFARVFFALCERPFIQTKPPVREEAGAMSPPLQRASKAA